MLCLVFPPLSKSLLFLKHYDAARPLDHGVKFLGTELSFCGEKSVSKKIFIFS